MSADERGRAVRLLASVAHDADDLRLLLDLLGLDAAEGLPDALRRTPPDARPVPLPAPRPPGGRALAGRLLADVSAAVRAR